MLQITFQFTNMADAAALLAQLDGHQVAGASLLNPISEAPIAAKEAPARAKKAVEPKVEDTPATAPAAPSDETINYSDLQKAVLKLYAFDKAAASAIATEMGFASFKVMPAGRWAEALGKVNAAITARG